MPERNGVSFRRAARGRRGTCSGKPPSERHGTSGGPGTLRQPAGALGDAARQRRAGRTGHRPSSGSRDGQRARSCVHGSRAERRASRALARDAEGAAGGKQALARHPRARGGVRRSPVAAHRRHRRPIPRPCRDRRAGARRGAPPARARDGRRAPPRAAGLTRDTERRPGGESPAIICRRGRLAQLVRAPALQAGGPRFEPGTAHWSESLEITHVADRDSASKGRDVPRVIPQGRGGRPGSRRARVLRGHVPVPSGVLPTPAPRAKRKRRLRRSTGLQFVRTGRAAGQQWALAPEPKPSFLLSARRREVAGRLRAPVGRQSRSSSSTAAALSSVLSQRPARIS